ncbi:hypothetical protein [Piscibacillus salipiscarius]|uniref:hypothetical protein n=1 Tax=Piscibacillus salipiscarius TaxID=299480 RepID=UPI0006D0A935|nr:hypothetical protein [Piscibacillus salipiscarius]
MHYEQQPPTFFHKRPPIITQKVQKQAKTKSRIPISDEQLKRLLLQHKPSNYIHTQKINIKRTLLTHLAYQKI